ncbi:uncharacterized protein OCT59_000217 [Rhizophagus irregularis]|uniref:uncharacterized protein n=1 Tax=Rhizophagus irregularis TaxID=588596 RepID=UPI003326249D|nr:hypothetical protein OCT59_000217 [Rhizophagus irregularis]
MYQNRYKNLKTILDAIDTALINYLLFFFLSFEFGQGIVDDTEVTWMDLLQQIGNNSIFSESVRDLWMTLGWRAMAKSPGEEKE